MVGLKFSCHSFQTSNTFLFHKTMRKKNLFMDLKKLSEKDTYV